VLTFAFCTYNRADRLDKLVAAMRAQHSPVACEILAVNNNSSDATRERLAELSSQPGMPLRWVTEPVQGIVAARNRAIAESLDSDILVFIDDDEIPLPGLLAAAVDAIVNQGAQCAGGQVAMDFSSQTRPRWLADELLGFLAAVDHGRDAFWIKDASTPVWTANIAYDMRLFRDDSTLRFDKRYDRQGSIGGGEDAAMLRTLLQRNVRVRYCPEMKVLHAIEPWRLTRSYFLKLHFRAGVRQGQHELPDYTNTVFGLPPFLLAQSLRQLAKALLAMMTLQVGALRQGMNAAHALGNVIGYARRTHP
jgi:glycosyltransferase involved in cell wall biosynthesis